MDGLSDRTQNPTTGTSNRRRDIINFLFRFQSYFGLIIVFLLAILISPVRNDANLFLKPNNLLNIVLYASETGVLAVGMTLVILVAGIDLSVGSIMALVGCAAGVLLMQDHDVVLPILGTITVGHWPAIVIILSMLLLGLIIGFVNGWASEQFKVQSFITTLAMLSIARGLAHIVSADNSIPLAYGPNLGDPLFKALGQPLGDTGIPVPTLVMLISALIVGLLLSLTSFGRHVYAVGGNPTAARLSGINVTRLRIVVFMLCGMFASIAGMLHTSRLNQGSPNESVGYELNAIAAVVIGGASLQGGKGTIWGSIGGALILQILDNIMGLNNVSSNVQLVVKGLLVIAAVALQQLRPQEAEA
ncbi:MAG: ABC transporter permease [Anaerolineae bacterium]|nr:ABC transporter permease [Anaerolineae bacterium]